MRSEKLNQLHKVWSTREGALEEELEVVGETGAVEAMIDIQIDRAIEVRALLYVMHSEH